MAQKIRFQDLSRLHGTIRSELSEAFDRAVTNSAFIQGAPVQGFEREFAEYTGSRFCLGTANGTDALELALEVLGIENGDGVVVPSMTFAATAEAVVRQGGIPVFAEVDETTACITEKTLNQALERAKTRVKAVIVVHLYGQACEIQPIAALCRSKNLKLVEDCAQAHGAKVNGRHVGTFGDIGTFSFYPGKNLGALGDAGVILTQSEELEKKLKLLRDHGRTEKYSHSIVGRNSRLDALQASFLSVKLKYLNAWTERRRDLCKLYSEGLRDIPGITLLPLPSRPERHVHHLYVIRVTSSRQDRVTLQKFLANNGIEALVHYPIPLHRQGAFSKYPAEVDLSFTERFASEILSLPLDPLMTPREVTQVTDRIREFFSAGGTS